ncbi:MAG: histidine kinase [Eubacterium sp.]|nr:histidine kinase [Eubacterium sp.]
MNGTYSLKKRILLLMTGFIGGVFLMGMISMAAAFEGHVQTQIVYQMFSVYNDYGDTARSLQKAAVDYYIHESGENRKAVLQKADDLERLSEEIQELTNYIVARSHKEDLWQVTSDAYAFLDLCSISGKFISSTRDYVNGNRNINVQDIHHKADLTLLQHDMLKQKVENIVNSNVELGRKIWRFLLRAILAVFVLMILYSLMIVRHLSRQVLKPIMKLTQTIQRFSWRKKEKESMQPDFSSCYHELLILHDAYSEMTDTIWSQILELEDKVKLSEELRKKETALSGAELSLMQSLITPHFLYNCLSTISSSATIEQAPQTYRSSVLIAKFLRESLNNVGRYITLWEEVNYTQHYIEILKLRFADMIYFSVSCDPNCVKVQVPAILLQPLIENAISHGVKTMNQGAEILVDVVSSENRIELCVSDNGVGISAEKQIELQNMLESDYMPQQKGVGLRSVAYRLRSIYGQKARVVIESKSSSTKVRIYIPRQLNMD